MRELLYEAAKHFRRGRALDERGDARAAAIAYEEALSDLHAVRPQRMRDVLLAQVYLSRHLLTGDPAQRASDLRMGYAYARTTAEPSVRALAERLWGEAVARGDHLAPAGRPKGGGRRASDAAGGGGGADAEGTPREGGRRRGRRRQTSRTRDPA